MIPYHLCLLAAVSFNIHNNVFVAKAGHTQEEQSTLQWTNNSRIKTYSYQGIKLLTGLQE